MVNRGFPKFGMTQAGTLVSSLKSYNLPDFVLAMVAKDCKSTLVERGRIDDRLQSMSEEALGLLHRIFVDCEDDGTGKFAQYRFYAYVSSMYHKCEILINETIQGGTKPAKNHRFPVAVKCSGVYTAVAYNKSTGNPVNTKEITRFYNMVDDVKRNGESGEMLTDAVYASSVGFRPEAIRELAALNEGRSESPENRIDFKAANFENNIYSVTRC